MSVTIYLKNLHTLYHWTDRAINLCIWTMPFRLSESDPNAAFQPIAKARAVYVYIIQWAYSITTTEDLPRGVEVFCALDLHRMLRQNVTRPDRGQCCCRRQVLFELRHQWRHQGPGPLLYVLQASKGVSEWVISKFNGTSTPKGSYSAKTGVNCTRSLSRVY